jgi:2-iminobutanoate/2-iminopropanoate deaminase
MTVTREVIVGGEVPSGVGPYSPAVRAGEFLFVSGQPGVDPATAQPVGPLFGEQARQAFRNLDAVLRAGGSRPDLVVETTVLVADAGDFNELNELFAEFFPKEPPTPDASAAPARSADLDWVHRARRELISVTDQIDRRQQLTLGNCCSSVRKAGDRLKPLLSMQSSSLLSKGVANILMPANNQSR